MQKGHEKSFAASYNIEFFFLITILSLILVHNLNNVWCDYFVFFINTGNKCQAKNQCKKVTLNPNSENWTLTHLYLFKSVFVYRFQRYTSNKTLIQPSSGVRYVLITLSVYNKFKCRHLCWHKVVISCRMSQLYPTSSKGTIVYHSVVIFHNKY